jgi:hypothetical protein
VGCVFNDREFFANKQMHDLVEGCSFNLSDPTLWKPMDTRMLSLVQHVEG